jgi:NitT/TauT family transport system substrate-binding protein
MAALGVSVGSLLAAAPAMAQDKISLQLPWILNVQHSHYVIARDKGFYADAGLEVEIRPGGVQINPNPLVATGQATFGMNDAPNLINSRAQGMPLVAVSACWQLHPGGLYALKETGIKEPKDLVGKTLAYDIGGPWTLVQAMLAKAGVNVADINLVNASGNEILMNGTVDARTGFVINGPVSIKLAGKETTTLRAADYGVPAYADVIFTTEAMVKDNPDLIRRFIAANIRGLEYAYAHPEEAVAAVLAANPTLKPEAETIQFSLQGELIFTEKAKAEGLCRIAGDNLAETYEIMKTYGGLEAKVDTSVMFTNDFLPK